MNDGNSKQTFITDFHFVKVEIHFNILNLNLWSPAFLVFSAPKCLGFFII